MSIIVLTLTKEGHKYLFSDATHSWDEALVECELYGGWLVNIGSVQEQNCLNRFAHSKIELVNKWYWTDGKLRGTLKSMIIEYIYVVQVMHRRLLVCGSTLLTILRSPGFHPKYLVIVGVRRHASMVVTL